MNSHSLSSKLEDKFDLKNLLKIIRKLLQLIKK
jgi:hypothetical protein